MKNLFEISDTDNNQQQNKKEYKDQLPAPSFNETHINTLCSSQELAPAITTDFTSLNTTTETSSTATNYIPTRIATNNRDDTSNFT